VASDGLAAPADSISGFAAPISARRDLIPIHDVKQRQPLKEAEKQYRNMFKKSQARACCGRLMRLSEKIDSAPFLLTPISMAALSHPAVIWPGGPVVLIRSRPQGWQRFGRRYPCGTSERTGCRAFCGGYKPRAHPAIADQVLLPRLNHDVTSDGIRVCKGLLCGQTGHGMGSSSISVGLP
jgi:hypothetical protein